MHTKAEKVSETLILSFLDILYISSTKQTHDRLLYKQQTVYKNVILEDDDVGSSRFTTCW